MTTNRTAARTFSRITLSAAARQGLHPVKISAEALHTWLPADGTVVPVWERIGTVHAEVEYGSSHMRRGEQGVEVVDSTGRVVLVFPLGQDRKVRTLFRSNLSR